MPVHSALGPRHPPPHDACCALHSPRLNADNVTKPLAVLALLVRYAHVGIPLVSGYSFETLLVAFLLLLAGNMFRGF